MVEKVDPEWKNYLIVGMVVVVLAISVVQTFQINSIKNSFANMGITTTGATEGGETQAQMMARMHPEQAAQAQSNGGSGAMIGGC